MKGRMTDDFVADWLTDGHVAHVCVDNQAYFSSRYFHGSDYRFYEAQQFFAGKLAGFTQRNRSRFRTVHVQLILGDFLIAPLQQEGCRVDRVTYDAAALQATPATSAEDGTHWVDLINPHYALDWVQIKARNQGTWGGQPTDGAGNGDVLAAKLFAENCKKILVTGAFGALCVNEAIEGARAKGFDVMVDPGLIWSHKGGTLSTDKAADLYAGKAYIAQPQQVVQVLKDHPVL